MMSKPEEDASEIKKETISEDGEIKGDDEEDIPEDFFDDFSNQDFMAGLDVVDAWDNENDTNVDEQDSKIVVTTEQKDEEVEKGTDKQDFVKNDKKSQISREKYRGYRSRAASRDRRSEDRLKKLNYKSVRDERKKREKSSDRRRDPEKTKRDILKDKDRRTKDEEAKIISEKLRVVETGLVPPGTEMDVDISTVMPAESLEKKVEKKLAKSRERSKERRSRHTRSKSIDLNRKNTSPYFDAKIRERRRSPSNKISSTRTRNPSRSKSPRRKSYRYRRSHSRSYERGRSPLRSRKRPSRYNRSKSPSLSDVKRKSDPRSPESDVSDRERWLRRKKEDRRSESLDIEKWSKSRDRVAADHRRHREFLEDLDRKLKKEKSKTRKRKDFLKEIHKKLNAPSLKDDILAPINIPQYSSYPQVPVSSYLSVGSIPGNQILPQHSAYIQNFESHHIQPPGPPIDSVLKQHTPNSELYTNPPFSPSLIPQAMVAPVPPPNFINNIQEENKYNEQFFIGATNPSSQTQFINIPSNNQRISTNIQPSKTLIRKNAEISISDLKNKETVKQLFEEKKISLADYLSLTAMESDPSKPVDIQNKIKVISRCQDAIKAIEKSFPIDGNFILQKVTLKHVETPPDVKGQSPLRKHPVVRFPFATPSKGNDQRMLFKRMLDKILMRVGVGVSVEDPVPADSPPSGPVATPPAPNIVNPVKHSFATNKSLRAQDFMNTKTNMKMCQTDRSLMKCHICEIRNTRTFETVAVQCDLKKTAEIGIQCGEERPFQNAFKNQSLAHLTPAQILKQLGARNDQHDSNSSSSRLDAARNRLSGIRDSEYFERSNISPSFNRPQFVENRFVPNNERPPLFSTPQFIDRPQIPNFFDQSQGIQLPSLLNLNFNSQGMRPNFNPFL